MQRRATAADGTWPLREEVERLLRKRPSVHEQAGLPEISLPRPQPASPPVAAQRFPRPPRPARPADLSAELQARWKEVLDWHDKMVDLDHFALLGIPYSAGVPEVQRAFAEQIKCFHPDKLPDEIALLQPYGMRIVARLHEARQALERPRERNAYLVKIGRADEVARASRRPRSARPARTGKRAELNRAQGVAAIAEREQRLASLRPSQEPEGGGVRLLRALRERVLK